MPKISLHVEADNPEEYLAIIAAIGARVVNPVEPRRYDNWASEPKDEAPAPDFTPYPDPAPVEEIDAIEIPAEPLEEKKARKPRGPNKPKMAPVTEDAPEEVEHVGTVAVSEPTMNAAEIETLTRMDLGDTIAGYVRKYGINFAQTDVSKMLQDMFGADVRKKSDVPDDQKSLRQAIATITQATIDNPYNRKVDVNG